MSATQHRGKRQRRRVVWDEDNLAHLEETKTPKQKIDEPKTPYHTLSLDPDEANGLSPMQLPGSDTEANPGVNPEEVRTAISEEAQRRAKGGGGWTSSEDEGDSGEFEKWMEERANGNGEGPSVSFQGSEEYYATKGEREMDVKAFKEHRRRHYDEFRRVKLLRAQKKDLEAEEGEEDRMATEEDKTQTTTKAGVQESAEDSGGGYLGGGESDGSVKKGVKGGSSGKEAADVRVDGSAEEGGTSA